MFASANQTHFSLTIKGLEHDFQVLAFTGREAISEPFTFDVELVSERRGLKLETLLYNSAFLQLSVDGSGIHGQIHRISQGASGKRLTRYSLTLRPQLQLLAQRFNKRIFQNLSVPQIIGTILEEHGILGNAHAHTFIVQAVYPERTYCVQFDESDLDFVNRLCEEEGIHYHFRHSAEGHLLTFCDEQIMLHTLAPVAFQQDTGMVAEEPVIQHFQPRFEIRPNRTTLRDHDFEKPHIRLEGKSRGEFQPDLEAYSYPGHFNQSEHQTGRGRLLASRALERLRSDYQLAEGESNQPLLVSGYFLELTEHSDAQWNGLWLLTEINHEGKQPQVLEESGNNDTPALKGDFHQGYRNRFLATPRDAAYRPPLKHPKPRMLGSENAVVTGPEGEEIHCDRYGRVKVQFHWDRHGKKDDKSSCWLRVGGALAGNRYGSVAIPRVGMEVLVTFLQGDPDQPMISGCAYHATNTPPYELPTHKTRSTFKTLSSPGGQGYNELRIEDKKGQEQIYVHAERDWDERIKNDQNIHVGHQRHVTVEHNSYSELKAEAHQTVHADRKVETRSNDHLTVGISQHVKLGSGHFMDAAEEIHLSSGVKIVVESNGELTLKAGGSFIKIDAGGITLSGPTLNLNCGGSPGNGSGAAPLLPGPVQLADTDTYGEVPVQAQHDVLVSAPPRCEVCEQAAKESAQ